MNRCPFFSLSLSHSLIWKCCPVLIKCRSYTLVSLAAAGNTAVSCSSCFSSSGIFQSTKNLLYSFIETVRALNGKWILKVVKTYSVFSVRFQSGNRSARCCWRSGCRRDAGFLKACSSLFVLTTCHTLKMYFLALAFFTITNCIYFLIGLLRKRPPTWTWTSSAGNNFCATYNLRTWIWAKRRWSYWIMSLWCLAVFLRCDKGFF